MIPISFSRRALSSSLAAAALTLCSLAASAQTPPSTEPPPASPPPGEPPAPPITSTPPPAAATPAGGETYPRMGKSHEIYVAKDTWIRVGVQLQAWTDVLQSSTPTASGDDGGYSLNFFLRRARLLVGAQLIPNVTVTLVLDAPRLGTATAAGTAEAPTVNKRFTSQDGGGEGIADMFGEIKFADAFILDVGLMFVPFSRNILTSSTTVLGLDGGVTSGLIPAANGQRDVGVQAKGYFVEDHLEYRVGLFSGVRQPANAAEGNPIAHNFFRLTGYLQYNIFDTEKGYTYPGVNFGKKKILGVSAGVDFQKNDTPQTDAYLGISAAAFVSYPLSGAGDKAGGDEVSAFVQYYRYDGGGATGAVASLLPQNDILTEAAYYNKGLSLGVFAKFEMQRFSDDSAKAGNTLWFGGGLKYYIYENVCNFTLAYNRVQFPDAPTSGMGARNSTNEFTLQTQFYYY